MVLGAGIEPAPLLSRGIMSLKIKVQAIILLIIP